MSNSVFQSVMLQLKEVTDRVFGVIDTEGYVVSCTDVAFLGERWPEAALKVSTAEEPITTFNQKTFKPMFNGANFFEYAVFCTGDDDVARAYCSMAYISLNEAKNFYEEKHDRGTFVKNIIMDNMIFTSAPRNCTLPPTRPGRYSWCASWVMGMWPRWMCCPACSRTRCRTLC